MSLKNQIQQNLTRALREGKTVEVSTLRLLIAAITNREIERRKKDEGLDEEEIIEVVSSEIKKRQEAAEVYQKGGRGDLEEKEKQEKEILFAYMPAQISEEEVAELVKDTIEKVGAKSMSDFGKVMGVLMPQVKGKVDGAMVSGVVRELLGRLPAS